MTCFSKIMMKVYLLFFLFAFNATGFSQAEKKKKTTLMPMACVDYVKQNSNSFGFSAGPALRFKRHTYIGILAGINLVYTNKSSYVSPVVFADYFYEPKHSFFGPACRVGYTSFSIYGQKDQYVYGDIGVRIASLTIMGGYNFSLDKKDISDISPYRITLRIP
jgi:hypothetical protein